VGGQLAASKLNYNSRTAADNVKKSQPLIMTSSCKTAASIDIFHLPAEETSYANYVDHPIGLQLKALINHNHKTLRRRFIFEA